MMESLDELRRSWEGLTKASDADGKPERGGGEVEVKDANTSSEQAADLEPQSSRQVDSLVNNDSTLDIQDTTDTFEIDPPYPPISKQISTSPELSSVPMDGEEEEEEEIAKSFQRSSSPTSALQRNRGAVYEKVGEDGVSRMHKFSLYETATYFYVVGGDLLDQKFRIMKIDRTVEQGELEIIEDDIVYTKREMNEILNAIDEGNKSSGGLKLRCSTWGLLGFIKFTGPYYALFITKRSQVAMIGGHFVYQIDATELIQVTSTKNKAEKNPEEVRFLSILQNLDLTKSFYFSYSYDITRTLQFNILRERKAIEEGLPFPLPHDHNEMFVWNHYLLEPAKARMKNVFHWCLPIIHGYVDQSSLSIYWGQVVYLTIIARRSRYFAGARFLKRGANDLGYVANDVETEQIVANMATTSFHAPGAKLYANPNYTSYVQHRGSIPLHWTQDASGMTPKPDIELNLVDPFYSAAALHFDNLFERYGAPIYVLNLIKARERTPRESKLLKEFTTAIAYLNQFLPEDKKIIYKAWDMSRASKSRDQDVIGTLEAIGEEIIPITGFFRNGTDAESGLMLQNGVARTNCIDCLDRTNAAQFVIGKRALGHQLHALGIIDSPTVEYDSDTVDLFTHMFHDHGDTIAVQYGGSHLVNTMATYRKINQWTSQSRDMVESFKRYYNNSFMDAQRQEAINLFLGNYVFAQGQPMLWDLVTDYYLHHTDPRTWLEKHRPGYINWFTPEYLKKIELPPSNTSIIPLQKNLSFYDDYWLEYYRPLAISSLVKVFSYKMHSNLRFFPEKTAPDGKYDLSPFKPRVVHETQPVDTSTMDQTKATRRKGVKILDPSENDSQSEVTTVPQTPVDSQAPKLKPSALGPWIDSQNHGAHGITGIIKEPSFELGTSLPLSHATSSTTLPSKAQKAQLALETFERLIHKSLNPTVDDEIDEYERYVSHPLTLPLVVTEEGNYEAVTNADVLDFVEYVNKTSSTPQPTPETREAMLHVDGSGGVRSADFGINWPTLDEVADQNVDDYKEFLKIREEGLSVSEEDLGLKRYKRYRQWLRGKSLFKQREELTGMGP